MGLRRRPDTSRRGAGKGPPSRLRVRHLQQPNARGSPKRSLSLVCAGCPVCRGLLRARIGLPKASQHPRCCHATCHRATPPFRPARATPDHFPIRASGNTLPAPCLIGNAAAEMNEPAVNVVKVTSRLITRARSAPTPLFGHSSSRRTHLRPRPNGSKSCSRRCEPAPPPCN